MNEIEVIDKVNIEDKIYEIRGKQVILDRVIAKLYKVETRTLIQRVKRNINRFPKEFCFQMTEVEFNKWRSQNVMSKNDIIGLRRPPYVFTEQGVAMLSAMINTDVAINESIKVMNAFVSMRKYISSNLIEQKYINELVLEDHENIKILQESFKALEYKEKVNTIFFEGQIYDAYSLLIDILSIAKEEIIIIDNYASKELLDIIKDIKTKIKIVSKEADEVLKKKYNKQYNNVDFINNNSFHDRFIIIDKKILYHCGASFKDIGTKCFAINKIEDKDIVNKIIGEVINE